MERPSAPLIAQSVLDITDDIRDLSYLIDDARRKLTDTKRLLSHVRRRIPESSSDAMKSALSHALQELETQHRQIQDLRQRAHNGRTEADVRCLIRDTSTLFDRHRSFRGTLGGLVTQSEWQSPGYASSGYSQAGTLTGKISVSINDYTRDNNEHARHYEQRFKSSYIDGLTKLPVCIYATHSGMAAFTTILTYLAAEVRIRGPVLVGSSTYFEARELLMSFFGSRAVTVDDSDVSAIGHAVRTHKPSAIFLDSLGNTPDMILPDMPRIAEVIRKSVRRSVYVVLDNTCLSASYQPLHDFRRPFSPISLIVYESLNKFHQFGTDRTLGGILWGSGKRMSRLFDYRVHLGTVIGSAEAATLPLPDRTRFRKRLLRLGRNNLFVAKALSERLSKSGSHTVRAVVYPKLPGPSADYAATLPFAGAFFMIDLKPSYRSPAATKRIAARLVSAARRRGIAMVAGTSFGFPRTRVYPTALRSATTKPFLRIAVGTETALEVREISETFADTLFGPL